MCPLLLLCFFPVSKRGRRFLWASQSAQGWLLLNWHLAFFWLFFSKGDFSWYRYSLFKVLQPDQHNINIYVPGFKCKQKNLTTNTYSAQCSQEHLESAIITCGLISQWSIDHSPGPRFIKLLYYKTCNTGNLIYKPEVF
jgi:hypothetical protein